MRRFCRRRDSEGKGYCGKQLGPKGNGKWMSGKPGVGGLYHRSTGRRVEAMGRGAVGTMRWQLHKMILRQPQWHWDRGWLQFRAQEEATKLRVRERVQVLGIACRHISGPYAGARTQLLDGWFTHKYSRRGPKW